MDVVDGEPRFELLLSVAILIATALTVLISFVIKVIFGW